MSLTPAAPPVVGAASPVSAGQRRVRHQARDAVVLMAFSAASSVTVAVGLLLLTHLSTAGR